MMSVINESVHGGGGGGERPRQRRQRREELHRTFPPQMHHVTCDIANQHTQTLLSDTSFYLSYTLITSVSDVDTTDG